MIPSTNSKYLLIVLLAATEKLVSKQTVSSGKIGCVRPCRPHDHIRPKVRYQNLRADVFLRGYRTAVTQQCSHGACVNK